MCSLRAPRRALLIGYSTCSGKFNIDCGDPSHWQCATWIITCMPINCSFLKSINRIHCNKFFNSRLTCDGLHQSPRILQQMVVAVLKWVHLSSQWWQTVGQRSVLNDDISVLYNKLNCFKRIIVKGDQGKLLRSIKYCGLPSRCH